MKLIYRAQAFEFAPTPIRVNQSLRAVNWRFQVFKESCIDSSISSPVRQPRALNWRFCLPVEV